MKKNIIKIAIFLVLISIFLVSCEEEPVYHYAHGTSDDVAVMGTPDTDLDNDKGGEKKRVAINYDDGPHNV